MNKFFVVILFLSLPLVKSTAQELLYPAPSSFQRSFLCNNAKHKCFLEEYDFICPRFAVLVEPSFSSEWFMYCHSDDYTLNLITTKKNIYYQLQSITNKRKRKAFKPEVSKYHLTLTAEQADILDSLFMYSVATAYVDISNNSSVFDGVRYTFMSRYYAAECKSPQKGACADLVDLVYKIGNAVINGDSAAISDLLLEAARITKVFRSVYGEMRAIRCLKE